MNLNLMLWIAAFLIILGMVVSALAVRHETLVEVLRRWVDSRVDRDDSTNDKGT